MVTTVNLKICRSQHHQHNVANSPVCYRRWYQLKLLAKIGLHEMCWEGIHRVHRFIRQEVHHYYLIYYYYHYYLNARPVYQGI